MKILLALIMCLSISCTQRVDSKMIEAGVKYDFDGKGQPSFLESDAKAEAISWAQWHANLDQAVVAKQYDLLVSRWKHRGAAFAVIEYTVHDDGQMEAHALSPSDQEFQLKFEDAKSEYGMTREAAAVFSKPNTQFEQLTLSAYKSMENSPLLKFPEGTHRKMVRDVRWHINAANIERSVKSRLDDVEGPAKEGPESSGF